MTDTYLAHTLKKSSFKKMMRAYLVSNRSMTADVWVYNGSAQAWVPFFLNVFAMKLPFLTYRMNSVTKCSKDIF